MTTPVTPVLHHVTMKTNRPAEMMSWYEKTIGLKPNFSGEEGAWLTNDAANHRVALLMTAGLTDDPDKISHTGMHHLAFEYDNIAGLLSTYGRLKEEDDITPHACLDHGLTTSLYYVDPDGNSVELQVDNFGSWDKSSEWMRTAPEYKSNPIGVNVDPDLLYQAWRAGADPQELHRRCYTGEFAPKAPLDLRLPVVEGSAH